MPSSKQRQGNQPARRLAAADAMTAEARSDLLARVTYTGSANHKLRPGDYGFVPSHNPRPSKTPCDDLRAVLKAEAKALFTLGIERGMISPVQPGGVPKYVWAVDAAGEPYEAKTKLEQETEYHGYRLDDDDRYMRAHILKEWKRRCP